MEQEFSCKLKFKNISEVHNIKADDTKIHEQERDVSKFWKKFNIRIAFIGLENQTEIEKFMPVRVIGYDGASYRSQILNGSNEIYPVITLVLYFGMDRWTKYRKLSDICDVPEELKPYFNDYHINVFEIAYLTDEQVAGFTSDFRIVADYFVQLRKNKNYVPSNTTIKHVDEVLKMMAVLTGNRSFENAMNSLTEGGNKTMDAYMTRVMGEAEAKGELCSIISLICCKLKKGKAIEVIADELEEDVVTIQHMCDVAKKFAPDYDVDKIYEVLSKEL